MTQNRLANETSPYLLQHKDNPVHWQPWDDEALALAKREDKPILLSIGYAACHWCHVMAHESFENDDIAQVMNDLFVNIKVDREQRPDLDTIYQHALALLGVPGGWPLTMFLTPEGEPFWGGTYFPPQAGFGRPGFADVLKRIAEVYRNEKEAVEKNKTALKSALDDLWSAPSQGDLSMSQLDTAASNLLIDVDPNHGGLGHAPKFPQVPAFEMLYRAAMRSGEDKYRQAALITLTHMCQGGIYDHLGGGFSRYAVDHRWLVPHFEKMLYDNAQLVDLLTLAWQDTCDDLFRWRIEETVGWTLREMTADSGAFAASLDADSEGEEGKFYVWTRDEIAALLPQDVADTFMEIYDVRAGGNWEGKTILNRLGHLEPGPAEEEEKLAKARALLFEARAERVRPGWDDKVLADWNGLMIAALANAGAALYRRDWVDKAQSAYNAIKSHLQRDDGSLYHSYRAGKAQHEGMLDDYAAMARAALYLHETTGKSAYISDAEVWCDIVENRFRDSGNGGYFFTAEGGEDLIVRTRTAHDNATPSGNAMMVEVLAKLFYLTGKDDYRARADALVNAFAGDVERAAPAMPSFLNAFETLNNAVQVVVISSYEDEAVYDLLRAIFETPLPDRVLTVMDETKSLPRNHPAHGKAREDGKATVYVCRGTTCSLPITGADQLREELRSQTNKLKPAA